MVPDGQNVLTDRQTDGMESLEKILVRIANREGPNQKSHLGLHCLSRPFFIS